MIDYIQHILEIEEVKNEADKLMTTEITKYKYEIDIFYGETLKDDGSIN